MKTLNLTALLMVSFLIYSCAPANEFKTTPFDMENPDFSFLKEELKGKRIVALGESSHGYGDLQTYKGKMVQYMHKELGYDVIMMEAGYGDTKITYENKRFIENSNQLRDNTLFQNFRSEEMTPLMEYVIQKRSTADSIIYAGYDTQLSGKSFKFKLIQTVKKVDIKLIQDSITSGLSSFDYMYLMRDSLEAWQFHKDNLFAGVDLAISVLDDNVEELLEKKHTTQKEFDILKHTLLGFKESVNYDFGETFTVGLSKRDSLMASNVIHQLETEYKDKKVILWGHNGHIEKEAGEGDNMKWMGHYLKEKYNKEYYALGMYCKKGSIYTHWNKTNKPFDITENSFIEKKLYNLNKSGIFANLPDFQQNKEWYNNIVNGLEPEAGGKVTFIPTKRFDGVLLIPETEAPTFIIKTSR